MRYTNFEKFSRIFFTIALAGIFSIMIINPAFATDTSSITQSFGGLQDVLEAVVTAFGTLVLLWGITEWGIAFQSNDGMMQSQAFKRIAGGLIITIAPTLLNALT